MKINLHRFIADFSRDRDMDSFNYYSREIEDRFAAHVGFRRHHTPKMRPDNDPKYSPIMWQAPIDGYVEGIRIMTFNAMYGNALIHIAREKKAEFPNGWRIDEVIQNLMQLRREYKAGMCLRNEQYPMYKTYAYISKHLINSMFYIVGNHGSAIDIGSYEIVAYAREQGKAAALKIIESGAIILNHRIDTIAYYGDQVEVEGVHHERFNKAVFTKNGYAYGNDIITSAVPFVRLTVEGFGERLPYKPSEDQMCATAERIARKRKMYTDEYLAYVNKTKEDVDREISCMDLSI